MEDFKHFRYLVHPEQLLAAAKARCLSAAHKAHDKNNLKDYRALMCAYGILFRKQVSVERDQREARNA